MESQSNPDASATESTATSEAFIKEVKDQKKVEQSTEKRTSEEDKAPLTRPRMVFRYYNPCSCCRSCGPRGTLRNAVMILGILNLASLCLFYFQHVEGEELLETKCYKLDTTNKYDRRRKMECESYVFALAACLWVSVILQLIIGVTMIIAAYRYIAILGLVAAIFFLLAVIPMAYATHIRILYTESFWSSASVTTDNNEDVKLSVGGVGFLTIFGIYVYEALCCVVFYLQIRAGVYDENIFAMKYGSRVRPGGMVSEKSLIQLTTAASEKSSKATTASKNKPGQNIVVSQSVDSQFTSVIMDEDGNVHNPTFNPCYFCLRFSIRKYRMSLRNVLLVIGALYFCLVIPWDFIHYTEVYSVDKHCADYFECCHHNQTTCGGNGSWSNTSITTTIHPYCREDDRCIFYTEAIFYTMVCLAGLDFFAATFLMASAFAYVSYAACITGILFICSAVPSSALAYWRIRYVEKPWISNRELASLKLAGVSFELIGAVLIDLYLAICCFSFASQLVAGEYDEEIANFDRMYTPKWGSLVSDVTRNSENPPGQNNAQAQVTKTSNIPTTSARAPPPYSNPPT